MSIDDLVRSRASRPQPGAPTGYDTPAPRPSVVGVPFRAVLVVAGHVVTAGLCGAMVGTSVASIAPERNAPWILGRATGIACLLLLTALTVSGLVLAHPWRARRLRPSSATRIRVHVSLTVFTLALFVAHVVVLATDRWAKVGWWGALLPMASEYRPVPVTLGVVAGYSGLLSGLTAALAGRWTTRVWYPLHHFAGLALVLAWLHGLFAGGDTAALLPLYLGSGVLVLAVGISRYVATTAKDRVRELIDSTRTDEETHA